MGTISCAGRERAGWLKAVTGTGFGRDIAIERFLSDFKLATPGYSEYNDDFHIY